MLHRSILPWRPLEPGAKQLSASAGTEGVRGGRLSPGLLRRFGEDPPLASRQQGLTRSSGRQLRIEPFDAAVQPVERIDVGLRRSDDDVGVGAESVDDATVALDAR